MQWLAMTRWGWSTCCFLLVCISKTRMIKLGVERSYFTSNSSALLCTRLFACLWTRRSGVKQRRANVEHRLCSWNKIKVHINRPTPFLQLSAGGGALSFFLDPGRQFLKHMHSHALACTPPNHRKEKLALRQTQASTPLLHYIFTYLKRLLQD